MNRKITLTTQEKTMNMAKLGIVSRAGNYFHSLGKRQKQRAGGLMRYTLCVFQPSSKSPVSQPLFAETIPVSESEVQAWLDTVPNLTANHLDICIKPEP